MNQIATIETKYCGPVTIGQRYVNGKYTAFRLALVEGRAKPMYICDENGEDRLFDTRKEAVKAAKAVFA